MLKVSATIFGCAVAAALVASAASAEPLPSTRAAAEKAEGLHLEWTSEPACGDAATVRAGALQLLGGTPLRRTLSAKADVKREGQGWQVRVETESGGERGQRQLSGESCPAVQRAVSLVLAMILESQQAGANEATPPAAPEPSPPSPPLPAAPPAPDIAEPPPQAPAAPRASLLWLLGPTLAAGVGATPHFGVSIGAFAGLSLGRVELGVAGRHWLAREQVALPDDPARPAHRIARQGFEAYACLTVLRSASSRLALAACVAPGATRVSAEAVRVSGGPAGTSRWSPSLGASLRLRYFPLENVFIGAAPGFTWARSEPFQLSVNEDNQPVYSTKDVFFSAGLETGLRF